MVTCWERADLLALVGDVYCIFVTFSCGILGQVWHLIVSFPDLCLFSYFYKLSYFFLPFLLLFFSLPSLFLLLREIPIIPTFLAQNAKFIMYLWKFLKLCLQEFPILTLQPDPLPYKEVTHFDEFNSFPSYVLLIAATYML